MAWATPTLATAAATAQTSELWKPFQSTGAVGVTGSMERMRISLSSSLVGVSFGQKSAAPSNFCQAVAQSPLMKASMP